MKKILTFLSILILAVFAWAQSTDIETVMEIQAERELANWIESMLYPIVGDNVAIVDMTLRYPSEQLKVFGSTLDKERSLPGLPVAKSSGVMPSQIAGEETYPTIVVKKVVTIYLSKNTTAEMEDFIRQNVISWVNISDAKGDKLEVKSVLDLKAEEVVDENGTPIIQTQDYRNYILLIGAILLLIIIIFVIVFSSRMGRLAKSMKEITIPGLDNLLRPPATREAARKKESTSKEPVSVRILPQDETRKEAVSFKFVEELSPAGCGALLAKEKPEDAAYVLSQLSPEYVSSFFARFEGNIDIILKAVIKGKQLTRSEISMLYDRLRKLQSQISETESLTFDNHQFITSLVNHLPAESSEKFFNKVNNLDAGFASLLRKDVFFLEDLARLDTSQIELIIRQIDRDILINYISFSPPLIKEKFFNSMTTRNRDIFADELENLVPLKEEEKSNIQNLILAEIRQILALV
ncbi:MAG: hypothetical protein K9N06_03800 [Candidatus Cloacimonetes bacterium]|nr:hypothetical protein [Candidatus Cloacimonadota bacterium]